MKTINVRRTNLTLLPDRSRVLVRPFNVSTEERVAHICSRVLALSDAEVHSLVSDVFADFGGRHLKIREFLKLRCEQVRRHLPAGKKLSEEREMLLGAYFTHEYSLEAAALFNPSIVPHPDQSDVPPGSLRFVLSLRATGEGHISSVTFRTGMLDRDCNIMVNTPTRYCLEPVHIPNAAYDKKLFLSKLAELNLLGDFTRNTVEHLGDTFTMDELRIGIERASGVSGPSLHENLATSAKTLALAQSNYEVCFESDSRLSERVLFPVTPSQSNGIEDARFVLFHDEDGSKNYYATYTAYDGRMILPQFIETPDFQRFKFITLNGPAIQNKGMALFPRRINGRYAMLGRQDYENLYVMYSDHLHFWQETQITFKPQFPWEFIQIGNCGSPIETDAGWLVLSHGVGAMRKYCIGAFLLDRDDPSKVIGRLHEPLIKPNENEREGYVPNVVYTCGSIVHGKNLVIPYAMSDYATTFAIVPLAEIMAAME